MALKGGEAGVECGDDDLSEVAVGKQADQVPRPFLVQLAGDEVIFAGKDPLEQRLGAGALAKAAPRALMTGGILHASADSKNGAS